MPRLTLEYKDNGGSRIPVTFDRDSVVIDAANFDSELALATALQNAMLGIIGGTQTLFSYTAYQEVDYGVSPPVNPDVKTHVAWVLEFEDTVFGGLEYIRVPTANISDGSLTQINTTEWDNTDPRWIAFQAAVENFQTSESNNPVNLLNAHWST